MKSWLFWFSTFRMADKSDKTVKNLETKVSELTSQLRDARRDRDEAQSNARRKDLQADEAVSRTKQQYEGRIAELERQLRGSQAARNTTFSNLEELVKRGSGDDSSFRRRLLDELRTGHDELEQDVAAKADLLRNHKMNGGAKKEIVTYGNVAPRKAEPAKRGSVDFGDSNAARYALEDAQRAEKRAQNLQNQLDALELQVAASQRVRAHLEAQVKEITADMEAKGGSRFSLDAAKRKLSQDNARLAELRQEEAEARRSAELALLNGEQSLRKEFQDRLSKLSDDAKGEEMRKTLMAQQRSAMAELERARQDASTAHRQRVNLEGELIDMRQRLDREVVARNEEMADKRRLQTQLQEFQINSASNSHGLAEARDAAALYKNKAESYLNRLENLEMDKLKAQKAESLIKLTLADTERSLADANAERKAAEDSIQFLESQVRELQARFESEGRDYRQVEDMRRRIAEEFESERRRYKQDLTDREELLDSTRRKYQQE